MNDFFGKESLIRKREHYLVRNDIIDEVGAHCCGIPKIIHLNGGGPQRQNAWPRILRIAAQVDGDVEFQVAQYSSALAGTLGRQIDKPVDTVDDTPPNIAAVV